MSAIAVDTMGKPGKGVKAKSGLKKSVLDQGWFEFRRQLQCNGIIVLERGYRFLVCGEDGSGLGRKPKTKPAFVKQKVSFESV